MERHTSSATSEILPTLCRHYQPSSTISFLANIFVHFQDGPTEYKSRTVFEDSTPDLVKDFYWDDAFRPVWDDMLIHAETLEGCRESGSEIAHWVRKVRALYHFLHFCSI